ncbi:MAG: Ig-like domain-containing protein, partial [Tumebacillaceae bacterium]
NALTSTTVQAYTGSTLIGTVLPSESHTPYRMNISKIKVGTTVTVKAVDSHGNASDGTVVTVRDNTPPTPPTVNRYTNVSSTITGKSEPLAVIKVKSATTNQLIKSGTAGADGTFSITMPTQPLGSTLLVTATDAVGLEGQPTTVTVVDGIPPDAPEPTAVTNTDPLVSGFSEPNSVVSVYNANTSALLGSGTAAQDGFYSFTIPLQSSGTSLLYTATDAAGNVSTAVTYSVLNYLPPEPYLWNPLVTTQDTVLSGRAENANTLTVRTAIGKTLGTYYVSGSAFTFSLTIPKQPEGTVLYLGSLNAQTGQRSHWVKYVVVAVDTTPPAKPVVNPVGEQDTYVTGTAEAGSTVKITANGIVQQTGTANANGAFSLVINQQAIGTVLTVTATDAQGNVSDAATVTVSDRTAPVTPTVQGLTEDDTTVTGVAEAGSIVKVVNHDAIIGQGTANADGSFSIAIPLQPAGTALTVTATDAAGNRSPETTVTVAKRVDKTPPAPPIVQAVGDADTIVTGTTEARATVTITANGAVVGTGSANGDGAFSIAIPQQSSGTLLEITATDDAGNVSVATTTTVLDMTAPNAPQVNPVTDQDLLIRGHKDLGATVKVYVQDANGTTPLAINLYAWTADEFYIYLLQPIQAGTKLQFIAQDDAGNDSPITYATVQSYDNTPPDEPVVQGVNDQDTKVIGTAEAGSTIQVTTNGTLIGTGTADSDGSFSVTIPPQQEGVRLDVTATDSAGNVSYAASVIVQASIVIDTTAPEAPMVSQVADSDKVVHGTAEAASQITVSANGEMIGSSMTAQDGTYLVTIPLQKAGTILQITATDAAGNVSAAATVTVLDQTAPEVPQVNPVNEKDMVITGMSEPGARMVLQKHITIEGIDYISVLDVGYADENGGFRFTNGLPQPEGTQLQVQAQDAAQNVSPVTTVTVMKAPDVTPPFAPTVNRVSDQDKTVSGTAEAGSTVTVMANGTVLGTTVAGTDGWFSVEISKQAKNTMLEVTATDAAGNVSPIAVCKVISATPPTAPTVNPVSDTDMTITGTAEPGVLVGVQVPDGNGTTASMLAAYDADADGKYTLSLSQPIKAGTTLQLFAQDAEGRYSQLTYTTVKASDTMPPAEPIVNPVTDQDTTVSGTAEAGSTVRVVTNGMLLSMVTAGLDGSFSIGIPQQQAGVRLDVTATDSAGNVSNVTSVFVKQRVDTTPPDQPTVNGVSDKSTAVSGIAEAGSLITVTANGQIIGTGTTGQDDSYFVTIPLQKSGTILQVTATDVAGNVSATATTTVTDVTAPEAPQVNPVTEKDTVVTGMSEPGARMVLQKQITIEGVDYISVLDVEYADETGAFRFTNGLPQPEGTQLQVLAQDVAQNVSPLTTVTVTKAPDNTPPDRPIVNSIRDNDTKVTGTAEAGSSVKVMVNGATAGSSTAGADGKFSVTTQKLLAGMMISVTATDSSGNASEATTVQVQAIPVPDTTPPSAPSVRAVGDNDTSVTGYSEAGATIQVKVGTSVIGTGTVNQTGSFNVSITKQPAGTVLVVTATDTAGNVSSATTVTVTDKTAPQAPTVDPLTNYDTTVTGRAEPSSLVTIRANNQILIADFADANGNYTLSIPRQTVGTTLTVTAKDLAGNESLATTTVVTLSDAPAAPSVHPFKEHDTQVTGTSVTGA